MKVLLIIWISAVLIQEVVSNTLVRLPRESEKKPSVVQTEYVAKYEQRGKLGNESYGRVTGKHEFVHDSCGDNWNSFADRCASLIKDLVASLANAVSSKPGDATNLQVQIKNTFRHFDNTHNCSCFNSTGKKLSDIDFSPIFKNFSMTESPKINQTCGKDGCGGNFNHENEPETNHTCDGHEGSGSCQNVQEQKQPNRTLVENGDSQMNPEVADGLNNHSTNNSRRQVSYPKYTTIKLDPSTGRSTPSFSYLFSTSKTSTPAPNLSDQYKSPLIASSQSGQSNQKNPSTMSPLSSSSNRKIPPSSDSQLLDPSDDCSTSETTKPHESSTNSQTPKPNPTKGTDKNQPFLIITPNPNHSKYTSQTTTKQPPGITGWSGDKEPKYSYTIPTKYINYFTTTPGPTRQTERNKGSSGVDDHQSYSSTTPIPSHLKSTGPVTTKKASESPEGSGDEDNKPYTSTTLLYPTSEFTKQATGSRGGQTQSPSKTPAPVIVKLPVGTTGGSMNENLKQSSSTTPMPTQSKTQGPVIIIHPTEITENPKNKDSEDSSSASPVIYFPQSKVTKKLTGTSESQQQFSSTTPLPNHSQSSASTVVTQPSGTNGDQHDSFTTPAPSHSQSSARSGSDKEEHDSSTTPVPNHFQSTKSVAIEQQNGNDGGQHDSSTTSVPSLYQSSGPIVIIKQPEETTEDQQHSPTTQVPNHSQSGAPVVVTQPSGSGDQHHSSTTLVPNHSRTTAQLVIEQPEGSHGNQSDSSTDRIPSHSQSSVPSESDKEECDSSTTPVPNQGSSRPAVIIQPSGSDKGQQDSSTTVVPNHSQTAPPVAVIQPSGANGDQHDPSTTPTPNHSQSSTPTILIKQSEGTTRNQHDSFTTVPVHSQSSSPIVIIQPTKNYREYFSSTTPSPNLPQSKPQIIIKETSGSTSSSNGEDHKYPFSTTPVPFYMTTKSNSNVNKGNKNPYSSTPPAAEYYGKTAYVTPAADSQKMSTGTSSKPTQSTKYNSDPYSGSQQEHPVTESTTEKYPQYIYSGNQPQYIKSTHTAPNGSVTENPTHPMQPGALIPVSKPQPEEEDEDSDYIQPTTFQTTSSEPTSSNAYPPGGDSTKPHTPFPNDTFITIPYKPSTSPKTTETQDDDDEDDEEDCCSCESCTEEEITDPKVFKENACKNLEEARRELKAIFNKIKKKLKCGRKAPQTITTR